MPTAIAPSPSSGNLIPLQQAAGVSRQSPLPPLTMGEKLKVLVLGDSQNGKTLLQIKNSTLTAESPLPLISGETLTVLVDQIHPTLVLRTISTEPAGTFQANEALKLFRSNPGALKDVIASLKAFISDATPNPLSPLLTKSNLQNIHRILNKIIISEENIAEPLVIKDYVSALGLTGERRLLKALSDPTALAERKSDVTLKEVLLKLSAEWLSVQTASGGDETGGLSISRFRELADHAATVIESLQIVNVLAQEQDGLFMLQLPLQFPDGLRMQELFIEADQESGGQNGEKQSRILLFLDMDSLGELAADVGIQGTILHCTFRCADPKAIDFIQPLMPALGQALAAAGYTIGLLQCVPERNIVALKQDFLQAHSLFTRNSVDVSV